MANFSPTQFGFAGRINERRQLRAQQKSDAARIQLGRDQLKAQTQHNRAQLAQSAAEAEAAMQQSRDETLRSSRADLVSRTIEMFDQHTSAAADLAKTGTASDEQLAAIKDAGLATLRGTVATLLQDISMRPRDDPMRSELQVLVQSLATHADTFDSVVSANRAMAEKTPEQRGAESAREQAVEIRQLSELTGFSEEQVAEGLGVLPGKPAPTEIEKIHRSLQMMDEAGTAEDDPRRLDMLNRLTTLTTPSLADIVSPILAKMAKGEEISPEEQNALDTFSRISVVDQLIRGSLGGVSPGGGVPRYEQDSNGNLVRVQ